MNYQTISDNTNLILGTGHRGNQEMGHWSAGALGQKTNAPALQMGRFQTRLKGHMIIFGSKKSEHFLMRCV